MSTTMAKVSINGTIFLLPLKAASLVVDNLAQGEYVKNDYSDGKYRTTVVPVGDEITLSLCSAVEIAKIRLEE